MTMPVDHFSGYHRPDGRVGVRNMLLVLSVTGLTGPTARRIANCISNAVYAGTPSASGLTDADQIVQDRTLTGLGLNPNVGAVLVVGANPPQVEKIAAAIAGSGKPVEKLSLDDCGHDAITLSERGLRAATELARTISFCTRQAAPLSALFLGLECGRSDPSSGLVSNPLLGRVADYLIEAGGTAVFGETIEWLGLEDALSARAREASTGAAIRAAVLAREQLASQDGIDLRGRNPDPTNIAAGLSTIEEKAIGNVAKSGTQPIRSLLQYSEAPAEPGLHAMDAAAYAPESLTGFCVAGAQLQLFTTGVGNSFVSLLAPTLKVSANPETTTRLRQQLDFDASAAFCGLQGLEQAAQALWQELLTVAGGALTWGEVLAEGEEVIARFGAAL